MPPGSPVATPVWPPRGRFRVGRRADLQSDQGL